VALSHDFARYDSDKLYKIKHLCIWVNTTICVCVFFRRKLHSEVGEPHHVLCRQCVCSGYCAMSWNQGWDVTHTGTDRQSYLRSDDHHDHHVCYEAFNTPAKTCSKPCSTCLFYLICKCLSTTLYMYIYFFLFVLAKVTCTFALYRICWCLIIKVFCFGFNNPVEENWYIMMFVLINFLWGFVPKDIFTSENIGF